MKLDKDQIRIIESEPEKAVSIKGVAGSGKTTIGVLRAYYLMKHYTDIKKDEKVLIITFNKSLLNHMKYLYEKVNKRDIEMNFLNYQKEIEILDIDSLSNIYFNKFNFRNNKNIYLIDNKYLDEYIENAIEFVSLDFKDVDLINKNNLEFIKDEISWIKASNLTLYEYQNIDRWGRSNKLNKGPQRLDKNSAVRKGIYYIKEEYDRNLLKNNYIDKRTRDIIALKEIINNIKEKYKHIVVDESQDLSKIQLLIIKELFANEIKNSSITFLSDVNQSIYDEAWLGNNNTFSSLGFNIVSKSRILETNYRTTKEISKVSNELIKEDKLIKRDNDLFKSSKLYRTGSRPIYKGFKNLKEQYIFLVNEINKLKKVYPLSEICIIGRDTEIINEVRDYLKSRNIDGDIISKYNPDYDSDKIKFTTLDYVKGLEFKIVFLVDISHNIIPRIRDNKYENIEIKRSNERKLLYTGITRGEEVLYIISVHKPSEFIFDMGKENFIMEYKSLLSPFLLKYNTGYNKTNLRDWMITELIHTYQYPKKDILIDRNCIIVNLKENNKKIHICLEDIGSGIELGIEKVANEIKNNQKLEYGVVTDGNLICFLDRDCKQVFDIPKYKEKDLIKYNKNMKYMNIKSKQGIKINQKHMEEKNKRRIPFLGNMEDNLTLTNELNYVDNFYIPNELIGSFDELYILKVNKNIKLNGINIKDYIIVKKQNYLEENDIALISKGNKRIIKEYEKVIEKDDIIIEGKIVGILYN